ncbi:uncharacterized protein LOC135930330 [Gordionus sp. m RMFG-2023]|uniref:uncharacterized protein LOC135930330 n=1 Tax=Gordionus sp. m RMFG-2023 TaxID=3053472 RepID=UPI0031FD3ED6
MLFNYHSITIIVSILGFSNAQRKQRICEPNQSKYGYLYPNCHTVWVDNGGKSHKVEEIRAPSLSENTRTAYRELRNARSQTFWGKNLILFCSHYMFLSFM